MITPAIRARAKLAQESIMLATVTVTDDDAQGSWEHIDGQDVYVPGPAVYQGRAKVQALSAKALQATAGPAGVTITDHVVVFPFETVQIRAGHSVVVDTSPDPLLVGQRLIVLKVVGNDLGTARRAECTLNLAPPTDTPHIPVVAGDISTADFAQMFLDGVGHG